MNSPGAYRPCRSSAWLPSLLERSNRRLAAGSTSLTRNEAPIFGLIEACKAPEAGNSTQPLTRSGSRPPRMPREEQGVVTPFCLQDECFSSTSRSLSVTSRSASRWRRTAQSSLFGHIPRSPTAERSCTTTQEPPSKPSMPSTTRVRWYPPSMRYESLACYLP